MDEKRLRFPDVPRSQLASTIGGLLAQSPDERLAEGRGGSLIDAHQIVMNGLNLEDVLRHVVDAAVSLVDAQYGGIGVLSGDGRLEHFIHNGMPPDLALHVSHFPQSRGLIETVIDCDEQSRLDEGEAAPCSTAFPRQRPTKHALLGVPIRVRGESFGTIYLTNRISEPFTVEDEERVIALAATAGLAIDNSRLFEEAQRRQRLNAELCDVTMALLSPESNDVFGVVADRAGSFAGANLVTIFVPSEKGQLLVETARGVYAASIEGTLVPAGHGVLARAIAGDALITTHDGADTWPFAERFAGGATISVPLVVSGKPVGALCVTRSAEDPPFSISDLAEMINFIGKAGDVIAVAWARADRQRLDVIDDRARIARDLHDHVIQRLFGTGLALQTLATADSAHAAVLDRRIEEIDLAVSEIRAIVFTLHSRVGSESTHHRLLDLATELTPCLGVTPQVTFAGPVDLVVIEELADDVFAVVREVLSNVARHAHANSVIVDVTVTDRAVVITIDDDGIGMPRNRSRSSGITNLEVRARARGGRFMLLPRNAGGTRACWHVPLVIAAGVSG